MLHCGLKVQMIQIQSLRDSLNYISRETLNDIFASFKCEKDEDIEKFLLDHAIDYEQKNICRTFFVMDTDKPGEILGYFSMGMNVMHFDEKIVVKDAYQGINLHENGYRPIYKLFMIGKNSNYKNAVKMANIFNDKLLGYLRIVQEYIGGDLMYIDCEPQLKKYYSGLGFTYYDTLEEYNLIRMIRKI